MSWGYLAEKLDIEREQEVFHGWLGQVFGRLDITNNGLSPLERIYLIDRHTTMETPIYSGPFPMTQCSLPPPNYLWISPLRTAYPGWHHQLILHLFACDRNWLQPVLDLDKVKAHLAINYPCYMMDDLSLEAIGSEYIRLDRIMQTAYRFVEPFVPVHRPRYDGFVRYLDGAKERLLEHVIDPALFLSHGNPGVLDPALFEEPKKEHVLDPTLSGGDQSSSSLRQAFSSCPRLTSGRTAGNKYGHETQGVINSNPKIEELKHEPTSRTESSTGPQPSRPFKVTKPRPRSLDSRRKTLSNNFVPSTLPTSSSYQFIDLPDSARPPSLSPTLTDSLYNIPTHTGSITKDVGQILFYAKNIHKVRQSNIDIDMSPPRQQPLEIKIIDGNTIDTSEMRLPDPTKYIQTSRNHFTIPASEAEAFCYWFEPTVDTIPDKIEGYLWYCDDCYNAEAEDEARRGVKGRFNQKRSVQRHHELVHRRVWKAVMPEKDRAVSGTVNTIEK